MSANQASADPASAAQAIVLRVFPYSETSLVVSWLTPDQGRITSLKHLKENVTEVKKDYECGIGVGGFSSFQPGDLIEAFVREKVQPI